MQLIPPDIDIDFIGKRKIAFLLSGLMVAASIVLLVVRGLNFGIDFTGGTLVEVRFATPPQIAEVRKAITPAGYGQAIIQRFGAPNEILIRVQNREGEKSSVISARVLDALNRHFHASPVEMRRVEYVGPQVGRELTRAGIMAVLIAMVAILLYVTFRFEFRFALGADAALLHDVTIVLGLFSLTGKEFTLPVVAALLTVIGYSLNDTIVVFDRIRENLEANRRRKRRLDEMTVANHSINQTLARTLMTSFTTLLVVFALFLLGGAVIHDFAFALIAGILVGTYSSIFVASPIMLALKGMFDREKEEAAIRELEARP
ncbi:MAG: protein translocase subunit SecF [Zetaproteobacteria bacterium]|nr:MAG: protein translocase subunit SecF [Zetaproteobacteria bacterium]